MDGDAELLDLIEDAGGEDLLGGFGEFDGALRGEEGGCVVVGFEAQARTRDIVGDDSVCSFFLELGAGIVEKIFGLGGEGDDESSGETVLHDVADDVLRRLKGEGEGAGALDFLLGDGSCAEV